MDSFTEDQKRFIDLSLNAKLTEFEWKVQFPDKTLDVHRCDMDLQRYISQEKIKRQQEELEKKRIRQNGGFSDEQVAEAVQETLLMLKDPDPKLRLEAMKIILKSSMAYGSAFQARQADKDTGVVEDGDESAVLNVYLGD